jgi:hypothetical protein
VAYVAATFRVLPYTSFNSSGLIHSTRLTACRKPADRDQRSAFSCCLALISLRLILLFKHPIFSRARRGGKDACALAALRATRTVTSDK